MGHTSMLAGGCRKCECLHDRPKLVPDSFLSQCETAASGD